MKPLAPAAPPEDHWYRFWPELDGPDTTLSNHSLPWAIASEVEFLAGFRNACRRDGCGFGRDVKHGEGKA
jgi:hypothetical protein